MNDTDNMTPTSANDPYAEFGGSVLPTPAPMTPTPEVSAQATTDPYAEFGGKTITTPTATPMSPELQGAYARGQHAPVTEPAETTGFQGAADQIARGAGRIGTGFAKGSAETIHAVGNFLNQHLGIPMPQEILHPELEGGTQAKNAGESVGKFGEAIGEFVLGD